MYSVHYTDSLLAYLINHYMVPIEARSTFYPLSPSRNIKMFHLSHGFIHSCVLIRISGGGVCMNRCIKPYSSLFSHNWIPSHRVTTLGNPRQQHVSITCGNASWVVYDIEGNCHEPNGVMLLLP